MVNKKSRGSLRTGSTQRRFQGSHCTRANGSVKKTSRHSETELLKHKDDELFDDGGLPSGLSLSLNKKGRWIIPELVEEKLEERYQTDNQRIEREMENQSMKMKPRNSRKKRRKSQSQAEELPLKSVVIERCCVGSEKSCKAVYSAGEECKIKKGKGWRTQLSTLIENTDDYDIMYEIESGMPSETWPFNCDSNSAQQWKKEQKKSWLRVKKKNSPARELKEAVYEWQYSDIFDDDNGDNDELDAIDIDRIHAGYQNDNRDLTLADYCVPKKKYLKKKKRSFTASSKSSPNNLKPCNPASAEAARFHEKNSVVYVESKGFESTVLEEESDSATEEPPHKAANDTTIEASTVLLNGKGGIGKFTSKIIDFMSGYPLKEYQECRVAVETASITEKRLFETYGNHYIESRSIPRKFAIILDQSHLDGEISDNNNKCFVISEAVEGNNSQRTTDLALKIFGYKRDIQAIWRCVNETELQPDFVIFTRNMMHLQGKQILSRNVPNNSLNGVPSLLQDLTKWKAKSTNITEACDLLLTSLFTAPKIDSNPTVSQVPVEMQPVAYTCGICYEVMQGYNEVAVGDAEIQLKECLHAYCKECWESYLVSKIHESILSIKCPTFGCQSFVDMVTILSVISPDYALEHLKNCVEGKITESKEWEWCPTCERAAFCSGFHGPKLRSRIADLPVVRCSCMRTWCFQCKDTGHWPAHCDDVVLFRKRKEMELGTIYDQSGNIFATDVFVKPCPRCSRQINKSTGCNNMICRCGMQFCWNCLKPLNKHDYFQSCKEVKATLHVFTSLDSFQKGHGKIVKKALTFRYIHEKMKGRKRKLGLDRQSTSPDKIHPLQSKEKVVINAIAFHKDVCNMCENLIITKWHSTSKCYNRRLYNFVDMAEFLLNRMKDVVTKKHIDEIDTNELNSAVITLKTHVRGIKLIGS